MKTEIDENAVLLPGDLIELWFTVRGPNWLKAVQLAIVESRLQKRPDYQVERWQIDGNQLIITVRIIEPKEALPVFLSAAVITPAVIAALLITAVGGLFVWLSLDRIYKITETPAGQISAISLAVIAAGILLLLLRK